MNRNLFSGLVALFISAITLNLSAQTTAFLYQGSLNDGGSPATGTYDFAFALYDASTNGVMIAGPQTNAATAVTNGLFTTTINFGNVFTGTNYWLAIAVRSRTNVTNTYAILWPRQPLLSVPYAVFANTASNLLGTLSTAQLAGTLTSTQLAGTYSGVVSFTNSSSAFAGNFTGSFTGNGAGLTSLNGSQITTGTVADARLSGNVALLNTNQTFTGSNTFNNVNNFTNRGNNFTGSFFGNGLVGWNNIAETAVQAQPDHGYLLASSGLTTVTLPLTTNLLVNDIVRISGAGAGGWLALENPGQSIIGNFITYQNSLLSPAYPADWRCIASSADGQVMYAGGNFSGGVYVTTDGGKTWSSTGITGSGWFSIACSTDGTKVFAAPSSGSIQYSVNSGETWSTVASSSATWSSIACSPDGTKFIATVKGGQIYSWSGTTLFAFGPAPGNFSWTDVAMSDDLSHMAAVYYSGAAAGIYLSSNTGAVWNATPLALGNPTLAMSSDGLKLVITIAGHGITTTTNFGASWTVTTAPTNVAWSCIAGSSDCSRLVAGISNSVLYASANFGATWTALNVTNKPWTGVAVSDDGSKFVATASTLGSTFGNIYYANPTTKSGVISTNSSIGGAQGSAVELQYIGNNQFMPVSSAGLIWAN